jgi:hypothetical protein
VNVLKSEKDATSVTSFSFLLPDLGLLAIILSRLGWCKLKTNIYNKQEKSVFHRIFLHLIDIYNFIHLIFNDLNLNIK